MKKILFILFVIFNLVACNNDVKDSRSKNKFQISKSDQFKFEDGMKKEEVYNYIFNILNDKNTKKLPSRFYGIIKNNEYIPLSAEESAFSSLKEKKIKVVKEYGSDKVIEDGIYVTKEGEELLPSSFCYIKNGEIEKVELFELSEDKRDVVSILVTKNIGELKLNNSLIEDENSIETVAYNIILDRVTELMKVYSFLDYNDNIKQVSVIENNKNLDNLNMGTTEMLNSLQKYLDRYNFDKNKIKTIIIEISDYENNNYILFENDKRIISFKKDKRGREEEFMIIENSDPTIFISTSKENEKVEFRIKDEKNDYSLFILKKINIYSSRNSKIAKQINCGIKQAHDHLLMKYSPFIESEYASINFTICEREILKTRNLVEDLMNFDIKTIGFENLISAENILYDGEQLDDPGKKVLNVEYEYDKNKNVFKIYDQIDGKRTDIVYLLDNNKMVTKEENFKTGEEKTIEENIIPNKFLVETIGLKHLFKHKN